MTVPQRFFVAGISFKKTDLQQRNKFAFTPAQCANIYSTIHPDCFHNYFILSTCNRTEIYGFAPCEYVLLAILQQHAGVSANEVSQWSYIKEGNEGVRHLMSVACGLDSQIPGDYEITAQIKSAFQLAKEYKRTNGFLEKLFNFALQASKEVKTETSFSNGTVSVVYTAVQKLIEQSEMKKVVVLGAGTTGRQIVEYLKKLAPEIKITLVNRNAKALSDVQTRFSVATASIESLANTLLDADGLIVATNADKPLVTTEHLGNSSVRFIFDLSVPQNVAPEVYRQRHLHVFDVDSISKHTQETIQSRLAEIPEVKRIIKDYESRFAEWSARHHYFKIASKAVVRGKSLSPGELTHLFQRWNQATGSDTFWFSTASSSESVFNLLKSAHPEVQLTDSHTYSRTYETSTCPSPRNAQQPSCFMASRCSCREAAAVG